MLMKDSGTDVATPAKGDAPRQGEPSPLANDYAPVVSAEPQPAPADARARWSRGLVWALVLTLLVRAIHAIAAWLVGQDPALFLPEDSTEYIAPARELLTRGTFTVGGEPELVRTPGYPLLLVLGIWLGRLVPTVVAVQCALSVMTTLGVYVLARRVVTDGTAATAATAAAALYVFEPLSITYAPRVVTETLFTAMVVWALIPIVGYVRTGRSRSLAAGSALLAASAYVRPAGLYLPFGLLLLIGVFSALRRDWRNVAHVAIAAVVAIAILLPWQLRNRALGYNGISAIVAVNMYFYNAAAIRAVKTGASYYEVQAAMGYHDDERYLRLHPEQRAWRAGERYEYMRREGARIVRENLPLYVRMHINGMMRVMLDPGAIDLMKAYGLYPGSGGLLNRIVSDGLVSGLRHLVRTNPLAVILLILLGLLVGVTYALAVRGLFVQHRYLDLAALLLVAAVGYFVLVGGGPAGVNRFRAPAMPLICVLAGAGWVSVRQGVGARIRQRAARRQEAMVNAGETSESPNSYAGSVAHSSLAGQAPGSRLSPARLALR